MPSSGTPAPSPVVEGVGAAARVARTAAVEGWLVRLLPPVAGIALLATGGLGRGECLRHTDLDLLLVHTGQPDVNDIADAVWYPVWDSGFGLDHSVRTVPEVLSVARDDVKAALGLLDARLIAGDAALADRVRDAVRADWRRHASTRLAALRDLTAARWERHGELAYLAEGDLKESRGGLRDAAVLRAVAHTQAIPPPRRAVTDAYRRLLDTREAVHTAAHRRLDRLVPDILPPTAALLAGAGLRSAEPGADLALELRRQVSDDARTLGYAVDDAWRAAERWRGGRPRLGRRGQPARRPLAPGVVEQNGEVVLARAALAPELLDQALPVRTVAAAARSGLPVAAATLEWLAATFPRLPEPWPASVREAFTTLLGAGPGLVDAWEAADRYGLVTRWLPEWALVRNLPHRSPVHRFTVDRHLVETVALATAEARTVSRPDLLLLAALLHDLGKGVVIDSPVDAEPVEGATGEPAGEDHAVAGIEVARAVTRRMGLPDADAATVVTLVHQHLLLPETATRRDLSDPRTVQAVAETVGDTATLDLLAALARADARAAGPAAASPWRMRLVGELVDRVRALLSTGTVPPAAPPEPAAVSLAGGPIPAIRTDPERVTVVAPADAGLLAAVAGCLAMHRLTVQSADIYPVEPLAPGTGQTSTVAGGDETRLAAVPGGAALVAVTCRVRPEFGRGPDPELLTADLRRAVRGDLPVAERLAARARGYRRDAAAAPQVLWHDDAATGAVVLELRADDGIGLLYRVADALAGTGAWVRAARVATLAGAAVDAFYLVGDWPDAEVRGKVEGAVLAAARTD